MTELEKDPDILALIADKLAEIFPDVTIYSENQREGFDVPSFYINRVRTFIAPRFFDIQDRTLTYQIVYFANPKHPNADLDRVEDLLSDNFIRLGDYATARNREFDKNTNEETLTMSFDLLLNMYEIKHITKQKELDINGRSKGYGEDNGEQSGTHLH